MKCYKRSANGTLAKRGSIEYEGRKKGAPVHGAELIDLETTRSSFLVCSGTWEDLTALAEATNGAILLGGQRYTLRMYGQETFRELKQQSEQTATR